MQVRVFRPAWILCAGLAACSKPVIFEGDTTIGVIGELPDDASGGRLEVQNDTIMVRGSIEFEPDEAIAPSSFELLNQLAALLKQRPEAKKLVFEACVISAARGRTLLAYLAGRGAPTGVTITGSPSMDEPSPSEPAQGGDDSAADDDTDRTQ